jgi:hypothetical protein
MEKIIENLLHVPVKEKLYDARKKLPLNLQGMYEIKLYNIAGEDILFVRPKEQITFPVLKKNWKRFQDILGMQCVVYDDNYSRYGKERMIELGIPFIFGQDIYMPMFGVILRKTKTLELPEIETFSPFTQKLVLTAIYQNWKEKTCREISEEMKVARVTVNRALVELQALEIPISNIQGKTRYFESKYTSKEMYEMCRPFMINPIAKTYRLDQIPDGVTDKSGMSALAAYSMLGDNSYETYGIDREEARNVRIDDYKRLPKTEVPGCMVQVLRYKISMGNMVDPISAILSLTEKEKSDPRVEGAIEDTLEEIWNGKWNRYF